MSENIKKYLLIPAMPTPNGRLHLGHIGGPFLSVDILARYLRASGHDARVMTGIDCYESYVEWQANKEKTTPEAICAKYYSLIQQDLLSMQIELSAFINPLEARWRAMYQKWHEDIFLEKKENALTKKETFLWDRIENRYVLGCWLDGNCPVCHEETSSYFCDQCGAHFRPEEMRHEYQFEQKTVSNQFLPLSLPSSSLENYGIQADIEAVYRNYLKQQQGLMRLTTYASWGVPLNQNQTYFSYGFVYAYYLLFGQLASEAFGLKNNAFDKSSSVTTIVSFGVDNAVPVLASVFGLGDNKNYKPVDFFLINYFYHLNNKKFSKSKRHAIWVNDLLSTVNASSDMVRLYLASIDTRNAHRSFDEKDFIHFYNDAIDWIDENIIKGIVFLPEIKIKTPDKFFREKFESSHKAYDSYLQPHQFNPSITIGLLKEWREYKQSIHSTDNNFFWWLKAYTVFLFPFMPMLAETLWKALGYEDKPVFSNFYAEPQKARRGNIEMNFTPLTDADLQFCLKEAINDN